MKIQRISQDPLVSSLFDLWISKSHVLIIRKKCKKKHKFTDFQTLKILSAHIGHPNNSHKSAMKVAASSPCHGSLFIFSRARGVYKALQVCVASGSLWKVFS